MDLRTGYFTAVCVLGLTCGLVLALNAARKAWWRWHLRIKAKALNDCKPGCFMATRGEPWEDCE